MESNLPLVIGLASGFAFLNLLLVVTWYLWECSRRRKNNRRVDAEDKLTALNPRHTKLQKARRPKSKPKPTINPPPDNWHQYARTGPTSHPSCISSPLPIHHSPTRNLAHHHHPLGLSSLRNEMYPPPRMNSAHRNSLETASVYSTMSAPSHLHDELLSDTHDSLSTAVNSHDDHYVDDKCVVPQSAEYLVPRDHRGPLYSIPEWEPDVFDTEYSRCWSPYLMNNARAGTPPMFPEQWPASHGVNRHGLDVSPLNIRKHTLTPPLGAVRQFPPARPPRCPSPNLPSPYSP